MIVQTQKDLDAFCKSLTAHPFITIDTEFLREKTYYPTLCLIQISAPDGNAVAIDPLLDGINLTPVFDILSNTKILKIFHAARQDLEIFYNLTGQVPAPFFDTQIAAMVCGYGDSISYSNLVRDINGTQLDKSSQFTNWAHRPLSEKQLKYALDDVTYLIDVYHSLSKELETRGRTQWVYEEEEMLGDPATYENHPQKAWERIKVKSPKPKTLAVLQALAAWREEQASKKNIPRGWLLRDDTLLDIAAQAPKNAKAMEKIRNIPKDIATNHIGKTLEKIINETLASDPKTWPKPVEKRKLTSDAKSTADILKLLLKVQCQTHDVATKLVASKDDIEAIALGETNGIPAMKGWRYTIFGQYIEALRNGDLAIGLKESNVALYDVENIAHTHNKP